MVLVLVSAPAPGPVCLVVRNQLSRFVMLLFISLADGAKSTISQIGCEDDVEYILISATSIN